MQKAMRKLSTPGELEEDNNNDSLMHLSGMSYADVPRVYGGEIQGASAARPRRLPLEHPRMCPGGDRACAPPARFASSARRPGRVCDAADRIPRCACVPIVLR